MKRLYFILIALFLLMGEAVYARENGMLKHLYASWYASTYDAASFPTEIVREREGLLYVEGLFEKLIPEELIAFWLHLS